MKNTIDFGRYRNVQFAQFFTHLKTILNKYNVDELQLKTQVEEMYKHHNNLLEVLNETNASELTGKLKEQDEKRGNAFKGIKRVLEGYSLNYDDELRKKAESLLYTFNKNGYGIDRLPYSEETAILSKLHADLTETNELRDSIKDLHLQEWVKELKKNNLEFQKLFVERVETTPSQLSNKGEIRKSLVKAYREFTRHLLAQDTLNPTPEYTKLIDVINSLIEKTNLDNSRRSSGEEEEETGQETEEASLA